MISCEYWYYTLANYKDDHELSGYQPCKEEKGRDVNNDHSGTCYRTDQDLPSLTGLIK